MIKPGLPQHLAVMLVLSLPAASRAAAAAACTVGTARITVCDGTYALCSQSTCRSTAKASDPAPVAECDCPVLVGRALADLAQLPGAGCAAPEGTVYSLFSTCEPVAKGVMSCPGGSFAQCWNASCTWKQGDKYAHCICPVCTGSFVSAAGGCDAASCVRQLLVGAPFPVLGSSCRP